MGLKRVPGVPGDPWRKAEVASAGPEAACLGSRPAPARELGRAWAHFLSPGVSASAPVQQGER